MNIWPSPFSRSRIESNSFNLKKERFDIREKIWNLKILSSLSEHVRIEIAIPEPILVEADRTRIYEVISNLVRNAIEFTDEGMISP